MGENIYRDVEMIDFQRRSFPKGFKDYFIFFKISAYLARARARASTVAPPPPRPVGGGGAPLTPLKKFLKSSGRARIFADFAVKLKCTFFHSLARRLMGGAFNGDPNHAPSSAP